MKYNNNFIVGNFRGIKKLMVVIDMGIMEKRVAFINLLSFVFIEVLFL
tara:strand:- start:260 stop:403 length:144 start_codon:yes stop_codon:yes gene_type:complete